jgi:hypothetical protein
MRPLLILLISCFTLCCSGLQATVVINEILAENDRLFLDADQDSPDWIELYNSGPGAVDLSGYSLSDGTRWIFPTNTLLQADRYLLIYASGKDRRNPAGELHTNFALDKRGESVILRAPDGTTVISAFDPFPTQRRNVSYGLLPGTGTPGFFETPTPGTANGPGVIDFVADTQFSTTRGYHTNGFFLSITSRTPNVTVRYTTDGSTPGVNSGNFYTSPILVNQTTTVRAIACRTGWKSTDVDAQSYLFPSDVINQPLMDQAITTDSRYINQMDDALGALPVVSLQFQDTDLFGATGIYDNPLETGDLSERPLHMEYFNPDDPADTFHIQAGVRIHGGNARIHPKKSLRLYFRSTYGNARLDHDLFPDSDVKSFKRLLLRAGGHDAWTYRVNWTQASYIRNEFLHRLQLAMGQPSPNGKLVHLYLNRSYWGLYDLQELPHADYHADHFGGEALDWDVIKHGGDPEDGTLDAWNTLMDLTDAPVVSDQAYDAVQAYINLDNFIDAMIHRIWSGDDDWLGPATLSNFPINVLRNKNWYVSRKSRNGTQPFRFFNWDAELSMGMPFAVGQPTYQDDFTQVNDANSPGQIYNALRNHEAFRIRFGDRLHKHFLNGGVVTPTRLKPIWNDLVNQAELPMITESARWGRQSQNGTRSTPYTMDDQWRPAVDWVNGTFLELRTGVVLNQFRSIGLYPSVDAPGFSPKSGRFAGPFTLNMTSPPQAGTVYYTRNGEDPRKPAGEATTRLIDEFTMVQALMPHPQNGGASLGTSWRLVADPTNIANWKTGANGVGFETLPGAFASFIQTPMPEMHGVNATCYVRIHFVIPDQATLNEIETLHLHVRYDDGYVAFLNNTRIAAANEPSTQNWVSTATAEHQNHLAVDYVIEDVTPHLNTLVVGANILAIQALNQNINSTDMLIMAQLIGTPPGGSTDVSPNAFAYTNGLNISASETIHARFRADNGTWSALSEGTYVIGVPATSNRITVSEIMYHPDDAFTSAELVVATAASDFEYVEILNVHTQTVDLTGCSFSQGIDFHFPDGAFLDPGERALIVNSRAAFIARYGGKHASRIAGSFENESKLADTGERLTLVDENALIIFSVRYRDGAGWPSTADGSGNSLVRVSTLTSVDLDNPTRWRASYAADGQPGEEDRFNFASWKTTQFNRAQLGDPGISGLLAVPPGAAENNLVRYAFARDVVPGPAPLITPFQTNGFFAVRFRHRIEAPDITFRPSISGNLQTWQTNQPGHTVTVSGTLQTHGDGTQSTAIVDLDPTNRRYLRLELNHTPNP